MSQQKSVVFVTPAFPSFTTSGLLMRAAATIKLLHAWGCKVNLVVIPLYYSEITQPEPEIAALCHSWQRVLSPPSSMQGPSPEWLDLHGGMKHLPGEWRSFNRNYEKQIQAAIEGLNPDLVLVFRFLLIPFVSSCISAGLPVWLDLDELESTKTQRLSQLESQQEEDLPALVDLFGKLEGHYLPLFKRIFVSSQVEADRVQALVGETPVKVLPNTYPRLCPQPIRPPNGKASLLYVGNFSYLPNRDAMQLFCTEILPKIQDRASMPVEAMMVGSGLDAYSHLPTLSGVSFFAEVPETTPYYASADLVVVPLRAAGGTRIKILEAFSHKRAVVSTTVGAEGLGLTSDLHVRIGDSNDDFAQQCLHLINNADERATMAEAGYQFFVGHHSLEHLQSKLPQLFGN